MPKSGCLSTGITDQWVAGHRLHDDARRRLIGSRSGPGSRQMRMSLAVVARPPARLSRRRQEEVHRRLGYPVVERGLGQLDAG